jgi:hypothetical protein
MVRSRNHTGPARRAEGWGYPGRSDGIRAIPHATPDVHAQAVPAAWTECMPSDWTCGSDQIWDENRALFPSSSLLEKTAFLII